MSFLKKMFGGPGAGALDGMAAGAQRAAQTEAAAMEKKKADWQAKLDPIRQQVAGMKAPDALVMEKAEQVTGALPEYERARQKVLQQASSNKSTNIGAIQRKAAALGASGGGAFMKQTQLASEAADQQATDATADLGAQESSAIRGINERRNELAAGRNFQREGMNADQQFKFQLAKIDASSKLASLDLAYDDADRSRTNEKFNMELANYQKQHSGGLFGAGGFLGTGIGA